MLALDSLSDFFRPGLSPDALPALNRLSAAWPYLAVFVTLFRGGDEEVLMRLLVLRELGSRAEAPYWTPQDIAQRFAYLNDTKLNTILGRLREGERLSEDEVREYCKGQIAHYKIPRYIRFVDSFPMTVTGKIQKFLIRQRMKEELGLDEAKTA